MPRDSEFRYEHRKSDSNSQSSNDENGVRNSRSRRKKVKSKQRRENRTNKSKESYESSASDSGNERKSHFKRDGSTSPRRSSTKSDKKKKHVSKKSSKSKSSKNLPSESPSSDSSSDSDSSEDSSSDQDDGPVERHSEQWLMEKLGKLQQEKRRKKDERKQQNEALKAVETPEEKRLRRLLKKEAKERKRKERMGWDKDYMHYTNTDNPFGDANLLQTFVWQKKHEKEGLVNATSEELECRNKLKQEENRLELEKVKKRRLEREQERAQREDEMQRIQRMKEAAQFQEWEKQEDNFHLQQARLRSKIRIDDGRAKPIDLLAKYISAEDEDLAVEMHEPYTYLYGLTIRDLEDLLEDIKVYIELERGKNLDYWNDITVIVDHELVKLRKIDPGSREHYGNRRDGINASVSSEVNSIFKGKSHNQLASLHDQIVKKIHSGEEGIDVGYWESLLSELKAHMARARLRDRHQDNLRRKLFQLKQEQGVDNSLFPGASSSQKSHGRGREQTAGPSSSYGRNKTFAIPPPPKETPKETEDAHQSGTSKQNPEEEAIITEADLLDHSMEEYVAGGYSPKLMKLEELEPGTLLTDPLDDLQRLQFARQVLIGTGSIQSALSSEDRGFEREARKGMTDDEAIFSVETALEQKVYLWSDKYRPRKPRYFNRVHTGFEWNKYNQTHYDMDNPPPKIVQGYKFNIFYPDLIDKHVTPEYTLTPCPDNKDFAILRFHAGPPYEDIAFKIVNREWEYSYKRGFRCQFHNNIFQLWFHFKRYRYRR